MRDGDFVPTRMEAQRDSVNLICGAKTQSHPENTVGVLTMAGTGWVIEDCLHVLDLVEPKFMLH